MLLVTCNTCGAQNFTMNGRYPDTAVECECCTEKHDHGRNANETGVTCRPITITIVPGSTTMRAG